MTTQKINLSIIPGGINPIVNVSQYDKGQTFEFSLFEGSVPFVIPVGSSITIQGTKKDGTGFQYACAYLGNVVTAEETQQMTVFAGDVVTEIRVTNGDDMIASANFIIRVEAAALRSDIPISETELPLLEEAVEAADEAAQSASDAEAYAVGTRGGVPVGPDDPAYENNAEYYATQPHVTSFKGRDGEVDPEAGDYDADQIDYDNTDSGLTATDVQAAIDELAGATYDADQIDYDNAGSGLTATDVQAAIDELAGATYDADQIGYDNTGSGLTATDVQEAIDELAGVSYDADQIGYDNTDSGLTATDVQEAIDELANRPSGGVTSFNGRSGAVVPTASDYDADMIDYDNSGSDLSSTNVNDAIDEVSTKISGYWTSTVNALVGDTTVTITDSAIKTTSVVEAYSQNASGSVTPIDGITVTNGQAVIRMPALTEATTFKLWIDENKAPSMTNTVVLWENTNTASNFAGQTVTLSDDIDNYDYYEVVCQLQAGTGSTAMVTFTSGLVPYDRNTQVRSFTAERYFAFNGNQCAIGNGTYYSTYGQAGTTDNSRVIPIKIIGFNFS